MPSEPLKDIIAALERGELLHVLAMVDAGVLCRQEFDTAWKAYRRRHWLDNFVNFLIGR